MKKAVVFGGTGFLGRYVVEHLAKLGYAVVIPSRTPDKANPLKPLGAVGQIVPVFANIHDEKTLQALLTGADTVINLVGILFERGKNTFERIHHQFPAQLAQAAAKADVKNFVQVSAIGAASGSPSIYAQSKAAGETAVLSAFPKAVIMRPSIVFGAEDGFFNLFGKFSIYSPVLPLIGGGKTRFQPVFVGDVADAIVVVLDSSAAQGKTYELGGAEIFNFKQLLQKVNEYSGRNRCLVLMPFFAAKIQGKIMQNIPLIKPMLTVDQVRLLKIDNIVAKDASTLENLGITPTALDLVLPTYMEVYRAGGRWGAK
jgi:NADH dehydrogenase